MTIRYPNWLKQCSVIGHLSDEQLEWFMDTTASIETRAKQYVFREYDAPNYIYLVEDGEWMSEISLADGRRQVGGFIPAGEMVGFGDASSYTYSVKVLVSGRARQISLPEFDLLVERVPSILRNLHRRRNEVMLAMTRRVAEVGKLKAHERLCTLLIKIAGMQRNDARLELNMTRQDIADYLGLTADTVVRGLKKLEADGIICIDKSARHVEVLRPAEVHRLATAR